MADDMRIHRPEGPQERDEPTPVINTYIQFLPVTTSAATGSPDPNNAHKEVPLQARVTVATSIAGVLSTLKIRG